jgi:hypothetical protein
MVARLHKYTNAPQILIAFDVIFLYADKIHKRQFLPVIQGGLNFFYPKIALCCMRSLQFGG